MNLLLLIEVQLRPSWRHTICQKHWCTHARHIGTPCVMPPRLGGPILYVLYIHSVFTVYCSPHMYMLQTAMKPKLVLYHPFFTKE